MELSGVSVVMGRRKDVDVKETNTEAKSSLVKAVWRAGRVPFLIKSHQSFALLCPLLASSIETSSPSEASREATSVPGDSCAEV